MSHRRSSRHLLLLVCICVLKRESENPWSRVCCSEVSADRLFFESPSGSGEKQRVDELRFLGQRTKKRLIVLDF